jgi:hypothetical protein
VQNLDSELAYFIRKLGQTFASEVSQGAALPHGAIASSVLGGPFQLDEEESGWLIRELEQSFTTTQTRGASVTSDHRPWLRERRESGEIDFYYWSRLQRYYLEGAVLPPQVIATLDTVTDEILDFSGDPTKAGVGLRRGMVMGHVQSGKTTNYSALICKAADAGYKTIILLAGITNSLRSQTQERLDDTFIGKKSVFHAMAQEPLPIQTYASIKRFPAYGTSRDQDFTRGAAGVFFGLDAHSEPMIFITKKNKAPLGRLRDWLIEQGHGARIASPLLLIDDEADNASINTSKDPKATTAINSVIRQILILFERRSYVGYTATPFANIFIDPDTEDDMLEDDLFPKHFIKALDPPSNYVGASRVFAEDGDLRPTMAVVVKDFDALLPLRHKSDLSVEVLPESLLTAMRVFVLGRAVRIMRGQGDSHCSMMVNVSRFNAVQEKVYGLVYAYLESLKNAAAVNGGLRETTALADPVVTALKVDFEREFATTGIAFSEILKTFREASSSIVPITVNMKGGVLEYSRNKEKGLHVIAIGGLALSRGLTLEGLTVSYILRNTAASDTLMQMARWFGYRPDYEDLCRVYLPKASLDHYEEIHEAIEELRSEVRRMQELGLTPEHFGLKVRQSPTAIRITAANKMRSATQMTVAQDYSMRHLEGYILVNDDKVNRGNLEEVQGFTSGLGSPSSTMTDDQAIVWRGVPGTRVLALLRGFSFSSAHGDLGLISGGSSLFTDYFADRLKDELSEWDVAVPHPRGGVPNDSVLPSQSFPLRQRRTGTIVEGGYRVTGGKNRVADPDDAQIGLNADQLADAQAEKVREGGLRGDKAYCAQRTRPLLLIHLFTTGGTPSGLKMDGPIVSLSFCLPATRREAAARTYQVNAVYRRQLEFEADSEAEDDEAMLEEG